MRACRFYPPLVLCCFFISIFAQSQIQKIYLHPKAVGSEKQSKFVDSIRIIPLEIKEDVELSAYNSIDVTKHYFLIKDPVNKKIILYSKNGSFIKKIDFKKLGEGF